MRVPLTHCDRSLSGVQIRTCVTRGSAAAFTAAAASASSASYSTIGHTTHAERGQHVFEQVKLRQQIGLDARRRSCSRATWSLRNDSITWSVATPMCVATRLFSMPRIEPSTPRTAATSTPLVSCGLRHRVVVPEQLVRAVDEMDDQGAPKCSQGAHDHSLR